MDQINEEAEREEDNIQNAIAKEGVAKRGWLYKAPSYTGTSISIRVSLLSAQIIWGNCSERLNEEPTPSSRILGYTTDS